VIVLILIGSILFSIIRNIRGLEASYPGVGFEWQIMIALVVTLASFVLTSSSILNTFDSTTVIRGALLAAGLMFSLVSFVLSFSGAVEDSKNRFLVNIEDDPEVVRIKGDLKDNLERQQEFGIDEATKEYLLLQETYIRNDLAAARDRARHQANIDRQKAEKESGKITALALGMFCALPEVGIVVFSLLVVLITGISVFSGGGIIRQPEVKQQASVVSSPEVLPVKAEHTPLSSNNGVMQPQPAEDSAMPGADRWNPFG